jgi:tRNA threonylcarbamoyl adenosine modification protein YeaZ
MKVLYINTASKIASLGLLIDDDFTFEQFEQDNNLAEVLDEKIAKFLKKNRYTFKDLTHVAVFKGPGGFTSLRIGVVMANITADVLNIPIIEISEKEENKIPEIIKEKIGNKNFKKLVLPFYGKEPNITKPKKH